ncbi:hypothetical protein FQN57_004141 [Myotisia sp. PD_48]|nr:hypothetical protein FQN57_004141 [Myotisia sp. PD_48]
MSTRNHLTRREGLRSPASSSLRHDLTISRPLPHPLPSQDSDNRMSTQIHSPDHPTFDSVRQSSQAQSPIRQSSQVQSPIRISEPPTRPTYHHDPLEKGSPIHQDSASGNISRNSALHRRRGSTLKTVMRRIFGRKPLRDGQDGNDYLPDIRRSTPSQPRWSPESPKSEEFVPISGNGRARSHRTSSLPTQEVSPKHSMHGSIAPKANSDVTTQPVGDLSVPNSPGRRRRATLPSIVLATNDANEISAKLGQPIPARSIRSVGSNKSSVEIEEKTIAAKRYKRRSRSAIALRETAKAHRMSPIQWRRRSDEIRMWRASLLKNESNPSLVARPETRGTLQETAEEQNLPEADIDVGQEILIPHEPGFDFETLMGIQAGKDDYLAQRVGTLEVKLMDLEFAISKLQGNRTSLIRSTPSAQQHARRPSTSPAADHKVEVSPVDDDDGPFLSSFTSTPSITPPRSSPVPMEETRPISTVTLRPHTAAQHIPTAQPPFPSSMYSYASGSEFRGISVEQYSALTTLMRREQSARKVLEGQLLQLQQELQRLRGEEHRNSYQGSTFLRASSPETPDFTSSFRSEPWKGRKYHSNADPFGGDGYVPENYHLDSDMSSFQRFRRTSSAQTQPGMI